MTIASKAWLKPYWIVALSLIAGLSGCTTTPLNHIGAFSQASADLARFAANGYEVINNTTIERRLSDIASETGKSPDENTFKDLITGDPLTIRIQLLKGVESYALALGELASAQFRKDIDVASMQLYGSLNDLQKTYAFVQKVPPPLTDSNLAIIATAIDTIGTAIVEQQRRLALKTTIIQADPLIQKTMQLISMEIPEISALATQNRRTVFFDMMKAYQHESPDLTYDARVMMLSQIRKAHDEAEMTPVQFEHLVASSQKIAHAHAVLRTSVEANKFTSSEMVSEIRELVSFAKTTMAFYGQQVP